jgi:TetR/AcrR family transcriptional repressor of mexJK operon
VNVAREVFLAEGYAAASMSAIAASVGGSKATLYAYFRSKADLFEAVMQDHCAQEREAMFNFDLAVGDLRQTLRGVCRRFLRHMLSEDVLTIQRLVTAESVRFPELGEALYEAGPRQGTARLAAYLEGEMAAGRVREVDPVVASQQLTSLCLSDLYRRRLWNVGAPPTDDEIDAHVEAGLATFIAAYGGGAP